MKYVLLLLALASGYGVAAEEDPLANRKPIYLRHDLCEQVVAGLTFAKVDIAWRTLNSQYVMPDVISQFFDGSWMALRRLARDNDTTVLAMLSDALDMAEFRYINSIYTELGQNPASRDAIVRGNIADLESLPYGKRPNNARKWDLTRKVFWVVSTLSKIVISMEKMRRHFPTFNPAEMQKTVNAIGLLEALDELNFDNIAREQEVEFKRVEAATQPRQSAEAAPVATYDWTLQSPTAIEPANQNVEAESDDLQFILYNAINLEANRTYYVTTVHNQRLSVILSDELIKDYNGDHTRVITRLVRSLITGRGDRSGMRPMFDIGPGIVELTSILSGGHKRILGCLEGNTLVLKRLVELNTSRASYSRRIPRDMCL